MLVVKLLLEQALLEHQGKVVYIDFWASWCVPCRKSFPWMNAIQEKYKQQGFTVVSINLDANKALAEKFLLEMPASFPVIYDPKGKIAKHFDSSRNAKQHAYWPRWKNKVTTHRIFYQ